MRMEGSGKIVITLVTVLLLVLTAACAPTPKEITPPPTLEPTPTGEKVNFRLLISDEVNAIGHFTSLNVTISSIGLKPAGEPGVWVTENITPPQTADLTKLTGDNATELWNGHVAAGEYIKVFIYVDNVTGDPPEDVKLPSNKLQISKPFTVSDNTTTSFVFDVTVVEAGKGGQYILKPQIDPSGPDKPFNLVTAKGKPEDTGRTEGKGKPEVGDTTPPEITLTGGDTTPPAITLTGGDTTPPVIALTGVADGEQYSEPVTPVIIVSDDTDPEPTVAATLNGLPFISETEVSEIGEYELEVTAVDASGNEAEVAVNFEIVEVEDTTPPEINVTGVADGEQYSELVTPVITVSDDTDLNPIVVATLNGDEFTSGTEVSEVREYELIVTAVDASGNEAELTVRFEIVAEQG